MDMLDVIASPADDRDPEDALKVLGRVADAFDNPSLHKMKMDKERLLAVGVVKSDRLLKSPSSEESVCRDGSYDSSFELSCDEDAEVVVLGDVSVWEHAGSYPYASRCHPSHELRSPPKRIVRKGDGMCDVTKMLLTSSPLDRLDRLARIELKKTGWFERTDKWSIVEMGLQGAPPPATPPKTPSKKTRFESCERPSWAKVMSPSSERRILHSPRRPESDGGQSPIKNVYGRDTPECHRIRGDTIKPTSMRSPAYSQESDSYLVDFSTLSHADTSRTTPIRASRLSRTFLHPEISRQQSRGRLGEVVRNFVKKMLPPSSGGGAFTRSSSCPRERHAGGDSPSGRAPRVEMTPRSNTSGESAWTFATGSSWTEASEQGWLDRQASNKWAGLWQY